MNNKNLSTSQARLRGAAPIAHWPLNEGVGTKVYDASGNLVHGTLSGASVTWVTEERFGKALHLGGTDVVDFGATAANFTATDSFSVVYWTKYTSTYTQYDPVVSKFEPSGTFTGWEIYMDLSGGVYGSFQIIDNLGVSALATTSSAAPTGLWHLIAAVCDRTTQLVKISLNGLPFATASCAAVGSLSNAVPLLLGWAGGQTATLHDVRIYKRALPLAEINQIYSTRRPGGVLKTLLQLRSPVVYEDSLTETATATDDESGPVEFAGELTEAATATDTPSATADLGDSVAETATATDVPAGPTVFVAAATEAASASDAPVGPVAFAGTVHTEYALAVDGHGGTGTFAGAVAAAATASDVEVVFYPGDISETMNATDEQCAGVIPVEDNPLYNQWKHVLGVDIKSTKSTRR